MTIEEYIKALQKIQKEHPNAEMVANFNGDDYTEPFQYSCEPEWSERDGNVWADGGELFTPPRARRCARMRLRRLGMGASKSYRTWLQMVARLRDSSKRPR